MSDDTRHPSRRKILGAGAALGAGALIASTGVRRALAAKTPQVPRKVLGKTGTKVPILLFGAAVKLDRVFDTKLAEAVRFGVDYVDCARVYNGGRCEKAVGSYMKKAKNRADLWLTTKTPKHNPKGFAADVDTSLSQLGTDYIDCYFLHGLKDADVLDKDMATMAEKLKKAGKIRHVGFSCHHGNVAELLHKAASESWVDVVMFRYNFRQYGNKELNKAIDAAAKANVGLIAMKTQGSAASFKSEWKKFEKTGKWNKYQAVLKAVWADDRITAAVSAMDTLDKVHDNVGAAVNKTKLTRRETEALQRYAEATRRYACDGCDHICGAHVDAPVRIGDTMRHLMYHDVYGETEKARALFAELPAEARRLDGVDFSRATAACPHGFDLAAHMRRAAKVLNHA